MFENMTGDDIALVIFLGFLMCCALGYTFHLCVRAMDD